MEEGLDVHEWREFRTTVGRACNAALSARPTSPANVLTIDGKTYTLGAGDSYSFLSDKPHRCANPGEEETVVLWANTPITLRSWAPAPGARITIDRL